MLYRWHDRQQSLVGIQPDCLVDIAGSATVLLLRQASTPTKQFKSHCAPEAAAQAAPAQMTVKELKAALEAIQLNAKGTKASLVARLQEAQAAAGMSSPCPFAENLVPMSEFVITLTISSSTSGTITVISILVLFSSWQGRFGKDKIPNIFSFCNLPQTWLFCVCI